MSDNFYAGRGGGASAPSAGGGARAPSGGGGASAAPRITPASVGGGVSRPQKTQILNHVEQASIGGPGAPTPHIGAPGPTHAGPGGNIGEHVGRGPGVEGHMHPGQRDERAHPDQFRNWDRRFDHDRDVLGNHYWRTALTDYEYDRFGPYLAGDPWLYQIYGVGYYPELINYAVPYYPTGCGPWNSGIWVIGADSRWYPVRHHHLRAIRQIEAIRGIGRYEPVIIPNCGAIGAYPPPVPTLYPAVQPYPYLL